MSFFTPIAIAALALLPFVAAAQQTREHIDPADAQASVPAAAYVSAFTNYLRATDEQAAPDQVWRRANEAVQGQGGHGNSHYIESQPAAGTPTMTDPQGAVSWQQQSAGNTDSHAGHGGHASKGR